PLLQRLCRGALKRRDHEEAVVLLLHSRSPSVLIDNRVNEIVKYDVLHLDEPDLLYYSISNGWLDVTRDLVTEYHFDPHGYYKSESCLYTAAKGNHVDIAEYLIKECDCNPMRRIINGTGIPVLHYVAREGLLNVLKCMVININGHIMDKQYHDTNGRTVLHCAVKHIDVMKYLIKECNCDIMVTDKDASEGLLDVLKCMVMNINGHIMDEQYHDTNGRTVLHCAVKHIDVIKYLIKECNCDIMVTDKDG
uniref:Uncharacterized protein n=1 Tax=Amphimedon queenslandica TaxID=400682 RepID=A0A1X7SR03_AMPQE